MVASSRYRLLLIGLFVTSIVILVSFLSAPKTSAAYDAGRIIDDGIFLDAKSMSIADIQGFLVARGSGLRNMQFNLQCYGAGSQERQWYTAAGARCDTPIPASEIIYYAAQVYGVNPKVILTTMQKEQSLTTAPNPTVWQLTQAMGYACPTSGSCSSSSSFPYQIDSGTWALRFHFERARKNMTWWYTSNSWTCGTEKHLYKPNLYPGQNVNFYDTNGTYYATIYIQNAATSTMYCYTPHAYNNPQGLYGRAPHGSTGLYYSGSYNFVYFFELWFGSTQGNNFEQLGNARWMQIKNDGTKKLHVFLGENAGQNLAAGQQIRFVDKIMVNNKWYLRTEFNHNDGGLYGIAQSDLEEIPYQNIAPKWVTFETSGNRSHPASRTSTGDKLQSGTSVKVVDQITVNGNLYYRTEYNKNNNQDVGIHSRFLTDFTPQALEGPRTFCTIRPAQKINPLTNTSSVEIFSGNIFINRKTLVNGNWYYQASSDSNSSNFFKQSDLWEKCYLPFEGPRSMRLTQDVSRFNPYTNDKLDTLSKGRVIAFSSKIQIEGEWYFRTTDNTQNNIDAVIPARSTSEL